MAPLVEVAQLTKTFGSVTALSDVTFEVREGEVFGFLGPNGAGKTTTIRILLGLVRPDAGTVRVGGYDCWRQHTAAAKQFGAVLEQPAFYTNLTGRQNLRQFGRILGQSDAQQIARLLGLVGLEERGDDKVKRYSMGMRQRLALAQAMLGQPKLLVLDEPTNGLDPTGIRDLRLLLRRLSGEHGLTIFFSSHLLSEVEELCDTVALLHRGTIRAHGPLADITSIVGYRYRADVSDTDRAIQVLNRLEGIRAAPGGHRNSITIASDRDVGRVITQALIESGVAVDQLMPSTRGLEEVYVELTDEHPTDSHLKRPAQSRPT